MKIHVMGAELCLADERTDRRNTDRRTVMTKLIVAFRNFANAPKNCNIVSMHVLIILITFGRLTVNLSPPEANVLHNCITLIRKLRAAVRKGYYTGWSWTKTGCDF
jgi:hypothetical protein